MEFWPLAKSVYLPKRNFSKFPPKPPKNPGIIWGGGKEKKTLQVSIAGFSFSLYMCVYTAEGDKTISEKPEKGQHFQTNNEQHSSAITRHSESQPQTTVIDTHV